MGGLVYVGRVSFVALIPLFLQAAGAITLNFGDALLKLQAQIAGALKLQAQLSIGLPSISLDFVAKLAAAFAISPPTASVSISALASLLASLNASIGTLQLAYNLALQLQGLTASVDVFKYEGRAEDLQAALSSSGDVASLTGTSKAILLVANVDEPGVGAQFDFVFAVNLARPRRVASREVRAMPIDNHFVEIPWLEANLEEAERLLALCEKDDVLARLSLSQLRNELVAQLAALRANKGTHGL